VTDAASDVDHERRPIEDRAITDGSELELVDSDWTTSDEAMQVLRDEGVEAWQEWCRAHAPGAEESATEEAEASPKGLSGRAGSTTKP
jgi:hypothetical protein